ncbi:ParA family protein [Burkholderia ubonensis]|uniref:ParA family protein n=1 Tax=Burkholderia ubonensis TaxID=101571 RepID=UPI000AA06CAB|nr:AAA family ATPase [Burkholderia ubonensis]
MTIKVFALYNNKGGVSKTTTVFNLAAFLSKRGRRTLIIDADSQSNATELFFASDEGFWDSASETLPGDSIYDALKPRLEGNASRVDVSKINLVKNARYENLYLLRGDLDFGAHGEAYFSSAVEQAITSNINQKNTYLCIRRLVRDLIDFHGFDHVVFDLGPSTGAISRLSLLACDGYFVPVTTDRFSALAVKSLPVVLENWFKHDKLVLSTMEPYGLESDYEIPVFCGAISQQFQMHRGRMKKSFERWSDRIKRQLTAGFLENDDLPKSGFIKRDPIIAQVENLGPLAPVSQLLGKAIFDITQEDTRHASMNGQVFYGAVFEPWADKIERYEGQMKKLARALE